MITDHDIYLFREGNHTRLYDKLGAHVSEVEGVAGIHFAVWAPNAERVSVIGDFNGWRGDESIGTSFLIGSSLIFAGCATATPSTDAVAPPIRP